MHHVYYISHHLARRQNSQDRNLVKKLHGPWREMKKHDSFFRRNVLRILKVTTIHPLEAACCTDLKRARNTAGQQSLWQALQGLLSRGAVKKLRSIVQRRRLLQPFLSTPNSNAASMWRQFSSRILKMICKPNGASVFQVCIVVQSVRLMGNWMYALCLSFQRFGGGWDGRPTIKKAPGCIVAIGNNWGIKPIDTQNGSKRKADLIWTPDFLTKVSDNSSALHLQLSKAHIGRRFYQASSAFHLWQFGKIYELPIMFVLVWRSALKQMQNIRIDRQCFGITTKK